MVSAAKQLHLLRLLAAKQERVISEAAEDVVEYRAWLADIIAESERLYRSQASALTAAETAIAASREKIRFSICAT